MVFYKSGKEALGETNPADTLILDFQPPGLWDNKRLLPTTTHPGCFVKQSEMTDTTSHVGVQPLALAPGSAPRSNSVPASYPSHSPASQSLEPCALLWDDLPRMLPLLQTSLEISPHNPSHLLWTNSPASNWVVWFLETRSLLYGDSNCNGRSPQRWGGCC